MKGRNFQASAEHFGYMPWVQFGYWDWIEIRKMVSPETIDYLQKALKNPADAAPEWFIHFAMTIESMGLSVCKRQGDIYNFIVKHALYQENARIREEYIKAASATREALAASLPSLDETDARLIRSDIDSYNDYVARMQAYRRNRRLRMKARKAQAEAQVSA